MKAHDPKEVKIITERLMKLLENECSECPYCKSIKIIKYGHANKQRYQCKSCNKTFVSSYNSLFYASHHDRNVWHKLIECELYKMTLKETAEVLHLSVTTCFSMRHKLYDQCAEIKKLLGDYQQSS